MKAMTKDKIVNVEVTYKALPPWLQLQIFFCEKFCEHLPRVGSNFFVCEKETEIADEIFFFEDGQQNQVPMLQNFYGNNL